METDFAPWLAALRHSQDTLATLAAGLEPGQEASRSYDSDWTIAQVYSHLGSQAQIFELYLDAAEGSGEGPSRDAYPPIWDHWNALSPKAQVADSVPANEKVVRRLEAYTPEERDRLKVTLFLGEMDATGLARMRLGEHAVHTWDVAVALDPSATVAADAVSLIVDTLPMLAGRIGKPDGSKASLRVATSQPERHFLLDVGEAVNLTPAAAGEDGERPELRLPAEAFLRLVYGRLDPDHTPPVDAGEVDLGQLRKVFPGW